MIWLCRMQAFLHEVYPTTTIKQLNNQQFNNNESSKLVNLLINSNSFVRILIVGVIAPIFEELIFRKVLIDHVAPKGWPVSDSHTGAPQCRRCAHYRREGAAV